MAPSMPRLCLQDRPCCPRLHLPHPCACRGSVPHCRGDTLSASRACSWGCTLIWLPHSQSYGPEHLLTFHNLKRIGLLTEQSAGDTLTAVESKVSKLVTDRAAGEPAPCPWEPGKGSCCCRSGWSTWQRCGLQAPSMSPAVLQWALLWGHQGWHSHSPEHTALHISASLALRSRQSLLRCFSCFPGKITDAFNSLARKSNFRAISKKLGLVRPQGVLAAHSAHRLQACHLRGTAQGQSCCSCSRQSAGFSSGLGVTATFPLCPDPSPCECGGALGLSLPPSDTAVALGRQPCVLHPEAEVPGCWQGDISVPGPGCTAHPGHVMLALAWWG